MDAAGIIWRLRNGDPPTQDELNWFAAGLADQSVSDAQAGAFAMAVCLNGLGDAGRRDLTLQCETVAQHCLGILMPRFWTNTQRVGLGIVFR